MGKALKIFFSETMRPRAYIFSIKQCVVVPYINVANQAPGVQIGHAPGAICLYKESYIAKEPSKIFFSETMRPRANILSMKLC